MDTFSVTAKATSQRGNRYMQLFVSDVGYMYVHPMKAKTEIVDAVKAFCKRNWGANCSYTGSGGGATLQEIRKGDKGDGLSIEVSQKGYSVGKLG